MLIISEEAHEVERFAASELQGYLKRLFGLSATIANSPGKTAEFLVILGNLKSNPVVVQALGEENFPQLSEQGFLLRKITFMDKPTMVIVGGSPKATLWAVYELVERWGVRYLLHSDVLPENGSKFHLPDVTVVMEPTLPVREWRVINDFACGPESWGMEDYRGVLDQLAKLKFNRILVSTWTFQPFLPLEVSGIKRQSGALWFDYHYPITDDMPGRHLFGDTVEFWNPDLPLCAPYEEFAAAGEKLVHNLMDYAHRRGMECGLVATLTEFPPEFASLLKDAQKVHQLGQMSVVPGPDTDVTDAALAKMSTAVLQCTVNTYPEVDYVSLGMPEWRQWVGQYECAWNALDAKYGLSKIEPLAEILAAAGKRTDYPGGSERAVQEVKGDIVALCFYDHPLTERNALQGSLRPNMKFVFDGIAEELFPVLSRILPPGSETMNFVDYTASRILRRREVLKHIPSRDVPCTLIYTLHDDNLGVLPQLTTGSLHELTKDLRRYGWAGFSTRYWLIGDHDPCVAYLSKAAWDANARPEAVYRDQIRVVCGAACVGDMLTVLRKVEATTVGLEWHGLGLTFPVPGMMMKHWTPRSMPAELIEDRRSYERALAAARRAQAKVHIQPHSSSEVASSSSYVDYWVGRLEFGIGYLDTIEAVRRAATAEDDEKLSEALMLAETALATARRSLESYARVARDQSDRGAIAVMSEYVYRPLKAKLAELKN